MDTSSTANLPRRRWLLPPVVLLGAILLELVLDAWLPLVILEWRFARWLGTAVMIAALAVNGSCAWQFRKYHTTIRPFTGSSALITSWLYRYSRNPIYFSMVVLLAGEALALGSLSPWCVPPLFAAAIQRQFIRHEEAMLSETLGDQYRAYCQRVRRWF
jgi:protein-S-isoprenylcysteine O-methyltransferase Ste14